MKRSSAKQGRPALFHLRRILVAALTAGSLSSCSDRTKFQRILAFELSHHGDAPLGWELSPAGTIFIDGEVVHNGDWSARLERDGTSAGLHSMLTRTRPLDFAGERVELRGWLRTEDVDGDVGLWMAQSTSFGQPVQYEAMEDRALAGTSDWTFVSIDLPVDERAETLRYGAYLEGTGTAWVDDLDLRADGRLVELVPRAKRETILDTDLEFADGSEVELDAPSSTQIESLVLLAKVWGFLKYHDPRIAKGEVHWDFELFRVLPSVLEAKDASQRNAAILRWAESLGSIPTCETCASPPVDPHLRPRIDWIRDEALLGPALSEHLRRVHRNRATGDRFWIGQSVGAGNAELSREPAYADLQDVDVGYRILAAFRLWNIIEYWFPYRDLIEEDWDEVLREVLPAFVAARERLAYQRALMLLIAHIHDTHAQLASASDSYPPVGPCGLPVDLRFLAGRAVVTRVHPRRRDGASGTLRPGDVLVELDGRSIDDWVEEWRPYYGASNEAARLRGIAENLSRGACGPLAVAIDRDSRRMDMQLERVEGWDEGTRHWHDRPGDTFELLGDELAYVKLSTIEIEDVRGYLEASLDKRGLVIDIRSYPNANVMYELGSRFISKPTAFVRSTGPDLDNPGAFVWGEEGILQPRSPRYRGKIVILVDELTQSAAEFTSMALRAGPKAIVVGSTTSGADGNASWFRLPGGEWSLITGIGIFYPDGRPTQRVGIVPDITVIPTREGVRDGRDEVLERALREILGPEAPEAQIRELAAIPPQD